MRDIPIIFSAPMVRALLAGRKTMTRRVAWRPSKRAIGVLTDPKDREAKPAPWQSVRPADRLWVREAVACECREAPIYSADLSEADRVHWKFRPSIHMPRWASRLTLIVGAVKIERLQEISHDDVEKEGINKIINWRGEFRVLWDSLHGAGAWDANPEVVVLPFAVHQQNVDALQAAA